MEKKIRLAFIGTYPDVSQQIIDIAKNFPDISVVDVNASFDEAVEKALELEMSIDAILSRGGTADYIKRAVHIPVIVIPISAFDLIKAIHNLPADASEVAFVHYHKTFLELSYIAQMYNIHIQEYLFEDYADIENSILDAQKKGITVIIGGEVACSIAIEHGLTGIMVSAGHEAVGRAIAETQQILYEKQREQNKSTRFSAAFESLVEGIVVLDEQKNVIAFNRIAGDILGRTFRIGEKFDSELMDEEHRQLFRLQLSPDEINSIRIINGKTYSVSHTAVIKDNHFIGSVSRYEDVTKVQKLEEKIRREAHFKGFTAKHTFQDIFGQSPEISNAISMAKVLARSDSSILIEGESGTGKEYFAQSIHNESERKNGPFVAVNCTAIPEQLLESELFGYEDGAFTGAKKGGKMGLFEIAHRGTLFLDEIGEISPQVQARLLRVLQEQEIMRVGGNRVIPIDVRIISATNRDLLKRTREGEFRIDLYYRLSVLRLTVPPLRKRTGDVLLLSQEFSKKYGSGVDSILYELLPHLEQYSWPGNVRELKSVIERLCILKDYLFERKSTPQQIDELLGIVSQKAPDSVRIPSSGTLKQIVSQVENQVIQNVLASCSYDQEVAAQRLGIGKTTLWRKLREERGDAP